MEGGVSWLKTRKFSGVTIRFNPWIGCTHVHAGCKNCYAEADMDKRRGRAKWGPSGTRSRTSDAYWREPLKWDRQAKAAGVRRRVFCASLADVFEDWQGPILDAQDRELWLTEGVIHADAASTPCDPELSQRLTMDDLRRDLFAMIDATPNLDWLLLTKRPENVRRMWPPRVMVDGEATFPSDRRRCNVWLLTSVSDQATADAMIPSLLTCRDLVPVLGLSCEPLLGPIDFTDGPAQPDESTMGEWSALDLGIDWVIVGGESGHGARPCELDWVKSIVRQCAESGTACFVKQLGSDWSAKHNRWICSDLLKASMTRADAKGGNPGAWPEGLRVRQFPEVPAHA